ncbi:MAG: hypothetical protein KGH71_06275, partial [Candidatus Micrarchaeota archaeon]|nr:hypothetical protein [Candidatus Micrarchaeota archaeon]
IKPEFCAAIWKEYGRSQIHELERFVSLYGEEGVIFGARQPSREKLEDFLRPEARDSSFAKKASDKIAQKPTQRWSKPGPKIQA